MLFRKDLFLCCCFLLLGIPGFNHLYAQAPPQPGDCLGAFPVCRFQYDQPQSFSGNGSIQDINNNGSSCLAFGERNSAWYIITVQSDGLFGFNVIPRNMTDSACASVDYDWALYDLTNATCADIFSDLSLEVACNYSGSAVPTPVTGMNDGPNQQDEPRMAVQAGDVYALVIDNFRGTNQCGYLLDFSSLSEATIVDNVPPSVVSIKNQVNCGANAITFTMSEYVKCNSVRPGDFRLIAPGGDTIAITGIAGVACLNNSSTEKEFTAILSEPVYNGGLYRFQVFGAIEDNCGNFRPDMQELTFNLPTFQLDSSYTPVNCQLSNGTATATVVSGGTTPFTYNWTPSGQIAPTAVGLAYGRHRVTVTDAQGCFVMASVFVYDENNFEVQLEIETDVCAFGVGGARAIVSGGLPFRYPEDPTYHYFWDVNGRRNDTTFVDSIRTGNYRVSVRDSAGCNAIIDFFVPDYRAELEPDFRYSPDTDPVEGMFPTVSFINQTSGATRYFWDFGSGEYSTQFEPKYVFPGSGTYEVKLIASNNEGCTDSVTRQVRIAFLYTFFAPNAFSPNADFVNDTFRIIATGIDTTTFLLNIYDRWGNNVFTTRDIREGWIGRYGNTGKESPAGIYVYRVSFIDQSGKKHVLYGKITLLG